MTAPAPNSTEFSVFLPFAKVDTQPDGTLMVHTLLNDETVDDQGEIVDFSAVEKASAAYMKWANVREMHGAETAAGTMVALTPNPELRTHEAILHVVDPVAVQKVSSGVYKGTSLGGFKRRIKLQKAAGGETVKRITEIDWIETSLVDRPSRPTARLTLLKRSDGGDPPPLIEEDLMNEEATVAAPETPTDAPLAKVTAPEAGTDTYTGPDGKPLATVDATSPAAMDDAHADDGLDAVLAKAAADDLCTADMAIEMVARLITQEAAEGDEAQLAPLRAALASLQQFAGLEATELGTPADVAEAAAADTYVETVVSVTAVETGPMQMAAQTGDLAKVGAIDEATVTRLIDEALAKRAAPVVADPPIPEEPPTVDEILAKTTSYIDERFARYVSRPDLDAMKAEILGALGPVKEDLAKIARFPAPGGPLRFAADGDRFTDDESSSSAEADILAKAARATSDPHVREELGRLAATAQIAAMRRA